MNVLTVKLEEADLLAAARLDGQRPSGKTRSKSALWSRLERSTLRYYLRVAFWLVFILFFVVPLGRAVSAMTIDRFVTGMLTGALAAFLCMMLFDLYADHVQKPRQLKRIFQRSEWLQRPLRVAWSNEGFVFENEQRREQLNWPDLLMWKEGNGIFLLYRTDRRYFIIPERDFPDEETLASFRSALQAHIEAA